MGFIVDLFLRFYFLCLILYTGTSKGAISDGCNYYAGLICIHYYYQVEEYGPWANLSSSSWSTLLLHLHSDTVIIMMMMKESIIQCKMCVREEVVVVSGSLNVYLQYYLL